MSYDKNTLPDIHTNPMHVAPKAEPKEVPEPGAPKWWDDFADLKNMREETAKNLLHGVMSHFISYDLAKKRLEKRGCSVNADATWEHIYNQFREIFVNQGFAELYDEVVDAEDLTEDIMQ